LAPVPPSKLLAVLRAAKTRVVERNKANHKRVERKERAARAVKRLPRRKRQRLLLLRKSSTISLAMILKPMLLQLRQ